MKERSGEARLGVNAEQNPVELARAGALAALVAVVRANGGANAARELYRWLCVAADLGHEEADEFIADLLERVERLLEVQAPESILARELALLRKAVAVLDGHPLGTTLLGVW